jgi:hypothetical protein
MRKRSISRTTATVAMVLGLAVSLSAQGTPWTRMASAFERIITGYEILVFCMVAIVAAAARGMVGASWRAMGNAIVGTSIVLGVRTVMSWLGL